MINQSKTLGKPYGYWNTDDFEKPIHESNRGDSSEKNTKSIPIPHHNLFFDKMIYEKVHKH
jgi:hypothetical protein